MRVALALLLFGSMLQVAAAAEPKVVEVPRDKSDEWIEFTVEIGRPLVLDAKTAAKWKLMDDGCDLIPVEGGSKAVFSSPKAGRYKLASAISDDLIGIAVTVGGKVPPKPPDPKPPGPDPKPIPPSDPLAKELRDLYAIEPAATRLKDMQSLSALYSLMVDESADVAYVTASQLNAKFVEARDSMLADPKTKLPRLPGIRRRCGAEVLAALGDNPDAALTPASRKAVAAVYLRLSVAVNDATK